MPVKPGKLEVDDESDESEPEEKEQQKPLTPSKQGKGFMQNLQKAIATRKGLEKEPRKKTSSYRVPSAPLSVALRDGRMTAKLEPGTMILVNFGRLRIIQKKLNELNHKLREDNIHLCNCKKNDKPTGNYTFHNVSDDHRHILN